jgi:hypothetical protein
LAVNPARRYGTILLWYRAGVGAIEGAFQEHTESWLIARCYRDTAPMPLESSCATEEVAGTPRRGGKAVTGGASRQGRRDAAAVGRRRGTTLARARAVLMLLAGAATTRWAEQRAGTLRRERFQVDAAAMAVCDRGRWRAHVAGGGVARWAGRYALRL